MVLMIKNMNVEFTISLIICNILALLVSSLAIAGITMLNKREVRVRLPVSNWLFVVISCYFVSIIAITIVPLPFSYGSPVPENGGVNLLPFVNTIGSFQQLLEQQQEVLLSVAMENIIGNIVMFLPFGVLFPLAGKKNAGYKTVGLYAFIFSLSIETIQGFSRIIGNYRQFDIDDIILNTMGALLGYFLFEKWVGDKKNKQVG